MYSNDIYVKSKLDITDITNQIIEIKNEIKHTQNELLVNNTYLEKQISQMLEEIDLVSNQLLEDIDNYNYQLTKKDL